MFQIKDRLDDIVDILKGDELGHSKGVIPMLKDHEDRIKKLEVLKDRATWTVLGLSIPSGFGVVEILKQLFGGK